MRNYHYEWQNRCAELHRFDKTARKMHALAALRGLCQLVIMKAMNKKNSTKRTATKDRAT
jgi:hypothetical protein